MGLTKPAPKGIELPALSNPATADKILSGYEAVDGSGNKVTGTSNAKVLPSLSNPATAAQILSGYQAINSSGSKVTGTAEKGYKIATGYVSVSSNTTIGFTIPEQGFTPVGVMYGYMANNGYSIKNMNVHWCGISTYNKAGLFKTDYTDEGDTNLTFNADNTITVKASSSSYYFLKGKYYYVVWGE